MDRSFRPIRVLGSTVVIVAALVILAFAIQDLLHYQGNLAKGYSEWATTGQGLWTLTCGVGEAMATVVLVVVGVRLLGSGRRTSRQPAAA